MTDPARRPASGSISNGAPLATDVVRDHLYKDITYSKAAGDGFAEKAPLTLGARFRDSGFKNGLIDDLRSSTSR